MATEVRFKVLKKGKSSEFNPRHDGDLSGWPTSAAQKIKKLSESPTTVPIVAKLCFINCKNKKNTNRFVQPVTPGGYPKRPFYNVKMKKKIDFEYHLGK